MTDTRDEGRAAYEPFPDLRCHGCGGAFYEDESIVVTGDDNGDELHWHKRCVQP